MRLTAVSEFTDAFLHKPAEQSEMLTKSEADGLAMSDLEQSAVLLVPRLHGYCGGETLARWRPGLRDRLAQLTESSRQLLMLTLDMSFDWIDYTSTSVTATISSSSVTLLTTMLRMGVNDECRSIGEGSFDVETLMSHLRELYGGDRIQVLTHVVGMDNRCLRSVHVLGARVIRSRRPWASRCWFASP